MGLFSKKKKDKATDGEDASRSSSFGSRIGKESPAGQNPYAAPAANSDPYAQPPPSYSSTGGQDTAYRQDKTPSVTGAGHPFGQRPGGYGAQGGSYGAQSGYGSDRFGNAGASAPPQRPGGYGGLGRNTSNDTMSTAVVRDELFGNTNQRQQAQPPQRQPGDYGQSAAYGGGSASGAYGAAPRGGGGATDRGFGSYEDRQLTEEEQAEEDILGTKQEISNVKQQSVASSDNALRLARQAYETATNTLTTLDAQGERIHNTERNLDLATIEADDAHAKTKELISVNRSIFIPVSSASKSKKEQERKLGAHQDAREIREATARARYQSETRAQEAQRNLSKPGMRMKAGSGTMNSDYNFEDDDEDTAAEAKIDDNLNELGFMVGRLKGIGLAMGDAVEQQNKHLEGITKKTDRLEDRIARNKIKLDTIH